MATFTNTKVVPIKDGKPVRIETYNFNTKEVARPLDELEKLLNSQVSVSIKK